MRLLICVMSGAMACAGNIPPQNNDADGGLGSPDAENCESFANVICENGNPIYTDSCGNTEEQITECVSGELCVPGVPNCCLAPPAAADTVPSFPFPLGLVWNFAPGDEIVFKGMVNQDPGSDLAMSLDTSFSIDGVSLYFALENWLPEFNGVSKGFRFYRVGSKEPSEVRADTGINFVNTIGVGQLMVYSYLEWTTGEYQLRVVRAEAQGEADWFDFYVTPAGLSESRLGGVLIPRAAAGVPGKISNVRSQYKFENFAWSNDPLVYPATISGATATYGLLKSFDVSVDVSVDGATTAEVLSEYRSDSGGRQWHSINASRDGDRVRLSIGPNVAGCIPAGAL